MSKELIQCDPDDPNRCQFVDNNRQCIYKTFLPEDKTYCFKHSVHSKHDRMERKRRYQLAAHYARYDELTGDVDFKNIRDEVAIQRMVLEEVLKQCEKPFDLLVASPKITDTCQKIQKSVMMVHKLETAMGQVLDKTTLVTFIDDLLKILSEEITDPKILASISKRLADKIATVSQKETV